MSHCYRCKCKGGCELVDNSDGGNHASFKIHQRKGRRLNYYVITHDRPNKTESIYDIVNDKWIKNHC